MWVAQGFLQTFYVVDDWFMVCFTSTPTLCEDELLIADLRSIRILDLVGFGKDTLNLQITVLHLAVDDIADSQRTVSSRNQALFHMVGL